MFIHNCDNKTLIDVAMGQRAADMVITNGMLMDVHSGAILPNRSMAVAGRHIAYIGPDASHTIDGNTRIIEAKGRLLAPGYIDAHTHIANYCDLSDLLTHAMSGGTTSFITEVETYGLAAGIDGIRIFLDQARNQPVKLFCVIPPMVTLSRALGPRFISPEQIGELLEDEMVIGLGESYWQNAILTPEDRVTALMRETLKRGKTVQGHAAGASDRKLAAYAAAGALSCHESVSAEDIQARLAMGFYVILREGYIRKDLESLRSLIGRVDLRRCALCTDGVDPEYLLVNGYFVDVVQKAVDMGIPPMDALRMATLNPAEHFGMSHLIGALAPGRFADILLLPELGTMAPDMVISQGCVVAEAGRSTVAVPRRPLPEPIRHTIHMSEIRAEDLTVTLPASHHGRIRTMHIQSNGLVAREGAFVIADAGRRQVAASPRDDLLKIVFFESVSGQGERFVGFIQGWNQARGAVATSLCWDSAGIVAVGADDHDLALAINQVIRMQGGVAIAADGAISVQIPFPIAGYISDRPIAELNRQTGDVKKMLQQLGVPYPSPILSLVVLTSAAIPFIRITEKGYFRFRENDYVGL